MKRITLTALLASAVLVFSLAQPPRGGRGDGAGRGMMNPDQLKKELNLTDEQVAKLKTINEEGRESMKKMTKENREEMRAVRDKQQAAVKEVLTSEQYDKLAKLREEARKNRRGGK